MVKVFDVYDSILICDFLNRNVVTQNSLYGIPYNVYVKYCKKWQKVIRTYEFSIRAGSYEIPKYLIKEATADEGMDDIVKQNNDLLEKAKKHKKFKSKFYFYLWMNYV